MAKNSKGLIIINIKIEIEIIIRTPNIGNIETGIKLLIKLIKGIDRESNKNKL